MKKPAVYLAFKMHICLPTAGQTQDVIGLIVWTSVCILGRENILEKWGNFL